MESMGPEGGRPAVGYGPGRGVTPSTGTPCRDDTQGGGEIFRVQGHDPPVPPSKSWCTTESPPVSTRPRGPSGRVLVFQHRDFHLHIPTP